MNPDQRAKYMRPYIQTSILKDEMLNLKDEGDGVNIVLRQANKSMGKDKYSAFMYALWWIRQEEERNIRKKSRNFSDFMFMG